MTTALLAPDPSLLGDWREWITQGATRFGATGFGAAARSLTFDRISELASSGPMHALALRTADDARGLVIVTRSPWETEVIGRPVAKLAWLAADSYEVACSLAQSALDAARGHDVVLLSAAPGHSPNFIHVALMQAGFHVGTQALTIRADLDAIAPALARIPRRGEFREATPDDADAVAELARHGFVDARFTGDPHFPREWGQEIYAAWGRKLVLGGADTVIIAEHAGKPIGFVSMTLDAEKRSQIPPLLAIDRAYNGWGIGAMLVRSMLEWYRDRGEKLFHGGTDKSNVPINALYVRLGVTFVDSNIVYHSSPALARA